ncbi:radical SAM protein [Megalodesulfovibrio paquesii]
MIQILAMDVVDACNLTCAACPRGRRVMKNTRRNIPLEEFQAILAKAKGEGIREFKLYNWTEPFIHPDIIRIVQAVKEAGMRSEISSNLSLKRMESLLPTLEAGLDGLIVSMSGVNQDTHAINHRGSRLEDMFARLEQIAQAKRAGRVPGQVLMRFLQFGYNAAEVEPARRMARDWGFDFEVLQASGNPLAVLPDAGDLDSPDFPDTGTPAAPAPMVPAPPEGWRPAPDQVCAVVRHVAVVDAWGMVHLCCVKPCMEPFRLGHYLELDLPEITRRMHAHPACATCPWQRLPATLEERRILAGRTPNALERLYGRRVEYPLQHAREVLCAEGGRGLLRRLARRVR